MTRRQANGWVLGGALWLTAIGAGAQTVAGPVVSASVTLGGEAVLTLRATAGGLTPQQRVDTIDGRLSDLLGIPNIQPGDVTVYTPAGKPPVIYALGRRLITVDAATAKSEGEGKKPLELAELWAKKLQQVLPRVNYRPSNEKEPVIPAHPPLTVTADLSQVGGNVGYVSLRNKVVFKITGPQAGGLTAQERAVMLTRRIQVAANRLQNGSAEAVTVSPLTPVKAGNPPAPASKTVTPEQISVAGMPIIVVDQGQAKASGFPSPEQLASAWAKNVRVALGLPATAAPPAPPTETTAPDAAPPTPAQPAAGS